MRLTQAIEHFRSTSAPLMEAKQRVKIGDYVAAPDGTAGYVDAIDGDMVSYKWSYHSDTHREWRPIGQLVVNPGGDPR